MERGFMIVENLFRDTKLEIKTESSQGGKKVFLEGPCVMAERVNRNGRNYRMNEVAIPMVERYNEEFIGEGRAIGECEHPEYPFPRMKEAAVIVNQPLYWQGNDAVGKLQLLNNPNGQVIHSLIEGGYNLGVSTRGLGSATEINGVEQIDEGFMMTAIDVVDKPSGQTCYVTPIRESVQWVKESDGSWRPNDVNGHNIDRFVEQERQRGADWQAAAKAIKSAIDKLG